MHVAQPHCSVGECAETTLGSQSVSLSLVAQSTLICPSGGPKALTHALGCFCLSPPQTGMI